MSASPVVVLGMHRSGTSTAAAALGHLGLSLGRSLAAADEWNPRGYFEDRELVRFDDALLARLGRRWDAPLPPDAAECATLADRVPDATALVGRCFPGPGPWAVKDPRLCLLWPFWREVFAALDLVPRCLVTLRHPAAVARSLGRRDGIGPTRAGWLWLTHVRGAIAAAADVAESRFVAFDDLVREPRGSLAALATWLGVRGPAEALENFAIDFIDPALVRQDADESALPGLVGEAYAVLRDAAAVGARPGAVAAAAAWQSVCRRFEAESLPELRRVQAFFAGDRQATRFEERLVALGAGLAEAEALTRGRLEEIRAVSAALERSEELATERLAEAARLDAQLHDTTAALARAEGLAATRLAELRRLAAALDAADQAGAPVVTALRSAERLARERLDELEAAADRERRLDLALAAAERLATSRLADCRRLEEALAGAGSLAAGRLQELAARDRQLQETSAALVAAEQLAMSRLADCRRLEEALAEAGSLAAGRLQELAARDQQLQKTSAALAAVEQLAAARLHDVAALDATLARTAAALAAVEALARERLAALERADRQLADTSVALARVEQLALERLATIEDLARQVAVFTAGLHGDVTEPVP